MTTTTVGFTVTGEFVTEFARDSFSGGDWRRAITFLTQSIEGLSVEQAIDILTGKKKITGKNDEIDLVDDNEPNPEYDEMVDYHYGSIYELKGSFYQPYAYVDSYCQDDLVGPGEGVNKHHPYCEHRIGFDRKVDSIWRALYYADHAATDFAICLTLAKDHNEEAATRDVVVLFKEVQMPPFWMTANSAYPQEVLDKYFESDRELKRKGGWGRVASRENLYSKLLEKNLQPEHSSEIPQGLVGDNDLVRTLAEGTGISPDSIASLLGEQDFESRPQRDKNLTSDYGYVLRDGSFYGCRFFEHKALATRIFKHLGGCPEDRKGEIEKDPDKLGESLGWIKITKSQFDATCRVFLPEKLTAPQKDTMAKWMVDRTGVQIVGEYMEF